MGLSNYIPSSRISQSGVCTSSTRPATPYEGQVIYETDTDRVLVWTNSSWSMPNQTTTNPTGLELITSGTASTSNFILNNCFSSTYDNYRIVFNNFISPNGVRTIAFQLTSGGSAPSSAYYWGAYYSTWSGGFGPANSGSGGLVYFTIITASNGSPSASQVEVQRPFIADRTTVQWVSTNYDAGYSGGGYQSASSSFDGFRITNVSSNDTNNFNYWLYGYRK